MDKVWASKYDDTLIGSDGNNLFEGREGNDTIDGAGENDTIWYRSEVFFGGVGGINANLGDGFVTDSFGDTDTVSNIESVAGTDFADIIVGNDADNDFQGFAGADAFNGAGGSDAVSFHEEGGAIGAVVNLAWGTGTDTFGDADTYVSIERLHGSSHGDHFTGSAADELFEGRQGDDVIDGGDGHDVIFYLSEEHLGGGLGIVADLAGGTVIDGFGNTDTVSNVENVVGTNQADSFTGNSADNAFAGYDGADTYHGGDGDDALDFTGETGGNGVVVNLADGTGTDTWGNAETFTGMDKVWGSQYDDDLTGNSDNNLFEGRGGNDIMNGAGGFDVAWYRGEVHSGGSAGVTVDLGLGTAYDSLGGVDTLIDIENAAGTDFADTLIGDAGDNLLEGFDGDDALTGGGGADTLIGGFGADAFVYLTSADGGDSIEDFAVGDRLAITAAGFGGGLAAGTLAANYFVAGSGAVANEAGHGQFLYDTDTGDLSWDVDGTDGLGPESIAKLQSAPALSVADFDII
jgi:Ca2+-binding RTX toxin-like protein